MEKAFWLMRIILLFLGSCRRVGDSIEQEKPPILDEQKNIYRRAPSLYRQRGASPMPGGTSMKPINPLLSTYSRPKGWNPADLPGYPHTHRRDDVLGQKTRKNQLIFPSTSLAKQKMSANTEACLNPFTTCQLLSRDLPARIVTFTCALKPVMRRVFSEADSVHRDAQWLRPH
ncbi:hypothetical protein P170DRAFT_180787 [Aspergillus steynii IBT 23096]|uniref:Uncharacterized protein n=1 Tax=Aspergillus steynii IBT 23096 TaxID=1392250 RepID=A0A2I2G919_9EURO|nr:uncharacterized protein P170DRAFT_180787 [Aspergillus steynii IBT 23096]PLB49333.1 hypothetical protein P170DRAFT_180787 [Aspergillus steynii IBT 23096]